MSVDLPYGDPAGMRSFAAALRSRAERLEGIAPRLTRLLPPSEFRGRTADSFRARQLEHHRSAALQREHLRELADRIDRAAFALEVERAAAEARRRAAELERQQRQWFEELRKRVMGR